MTAAKQTLIQEVGKLRDYATTQASTMVVAKDRFTYVWGIPMKQLQELADSIPQTHQKHLIALELLDANIFEVIQLGLLTLDWNLLDSGRTCEVLWALPFNKLINEACESMVTVVHHDKLKGTFQNLLLHANRGKENENCFLRFSFKYFQILSGSEGYSVYNELISYIQNHFLGNVENNQKLMLRLLRLFRNKHESKRLNGVIQNIRQNASNHKHLDRYLESLF